MTNIGDWFQGAGKFAADMLGLGPDSLPRGLTAAATKLVETLDTTIANTYVENGWADIQKTKPNIRNVITQTPELIVVIKKRMFSSLKDNFTTENMDATEKELLRASKKLFENKCREISAYESLSKIEHIVTKEGAVNSGIITSALDALDQTQGVLSWNGLLTSSPEISKLQQVASKLRDVLLQNGYSTTTNWVQNTRAPSFYSGAGTGVIELTMVTSFNCTTSVRFGQGNASFSIIDPYRILAVTEQDIERAMFESSDGKFNLINSLADSLQNEVDQTLQSLNELREFRNASPVSIVTNPYNRVYNRITIILDRYGIELTSPDGDGLRSDLFDVSEEEAIATFEGLINTVVLPPSSWSKSAVSNAQSLAALEMFKNNPTPNAPKGLGWAYDLQTYDEKKLLKEVYEKSIMLSALRQKDYNDFIDYGQRTNYVRRCMRQNFLGKQIIQPMDIVTAFITSQTIEDNAALAGLKSMFSVTGSALDTIRNASTGTGRALKFIGEKTGNEWLETAGTDIVSQANQNDQWLREKVSEARQYLSQQTIDGGTTLTSYLNNNIGDLKDLWGSIFGSSRPNYALEAEKNMLAGPDFPMYLYLSLRSYFGATDYGPCVFNGVVTDVSEAGQPGNYTVSVNCKDNTYYFEQGLYNDKPSVNQFNGHLYNPLTPFDTEFDEATGRVNFESNFKLLDENLVLLNSGALKYKFGRFVNQNITTKNIHQTALEEISNESDSSRREANYNLLNLNDKTSVVQDVARKIFYNPDGFVYRWKKGIGTAWMNNNSRNFAGSVLSEEKADNSMANIIRSDPFSGQDLVNIVSLLITGEPYNLTTFVNAAITSGIMRVIPGQTVNDYISGLTGQIRRQNSIWGNFVPFKRFSVNPAFFNQLFTSQLTIKSHSNKISQLEEKKSNLMEKLMKLDSTYQTLSNLNNLRGFTFDSIREGERTITVKNTGAISLVQQILTLDNEIKASQSKIQASVMNGDMRIFADDIYSSYDGDMEALKKESRAAYKAAFNNLRKKQNFISQRRLWQVKSNTDTNLFIVCDEYDHDVDIQATVQSLGSLELINAKSFRTVSEKIRAVTGLIGMEIFANSQGHIELRIPQYNRMPSSLFYKMADKKRKFGIQYYPTFLEKTYQNRLNNVYDEIETIECWIRIYCTVLGYDSDEKRVPFLSGSNMPTKNQFTFLTWELWGTLSSLRAASSQISTDFTDQYETEKSISITTKSKGDFFERNLDNDFITGRYNYFTTNLNKSNSASNAGFNEVLTDSLSPIGVTEQIKRFQTVVFDTNNNFDVLKQVENLTELYTKDLSVPDLNQSWVRKTLQDLLDQQAKRTGTKLEASAFIKSVLGNSKKFISPSDLFAVEKIIAKYISQRYRAILSASSLIRNLDQAARANANDSSLLSGIMLPNLVKDGDVPDFMAHMIEDETEDDYGYQSGKRYVIRPQDVLSSTYKEQAPEFTSIKVQGAESGALVGGSGFDVGGGMEVKSVWATDYDLWRMYGFKDGAERYIPFLNNVETQITPYAIFLLNQQRSALLHASVTRVGNEFIQPGEVYYLEDRDLLFYCEQVTQSFSYGSPGNFQTNMSLTYGHGIGEYIPTPLDVIGKSIYRGHYTNIGSYRMSNPAGGKITPGYEVHMGTIAFVQKDSEVVPQDIASAGEEIRSGEFGKQNINTLNDIMYKVKNIMTSSLGDVKTDKCATVCIRIYTDGGEFNGSLIYAAGYVADYLKHPAPYTNEQESEADSSGLMALALDPSRILGGEKDEQIEPKAFRLVDIKSKPLQITSNVFPVVRTPSAKAIELAKQIAVSQRGIWNSIVSAFNNPDQQTNVESRQLRNALCKCIIDVWVEFIDQSLIGVKLNSPYTTSNMNQNQNKNTVKNEIDPYGIDKFYNNIKTTDSTYVSPLGESIKIKYDDSYEGVEIVSDIQELIED